MMNYSSLEEKNMGKVIQSLEQVLVAEEKM